MVVEADADPLVARTMRRHFVAQPALEQDHLAGARRIGDVRPLLDRYGPFVREEPSMMVRLRREKSLDLPYSLLPQDLHTF